MESLSLNYWYQMLKAKLEGYPPYLPDIIMGLSLGLLAGFLLKTLGRFLIIGLIVTAGVLWLADYFNLITIHQHEVTSLIGMQPFSSFQEFGAYAAALMKEHVAGTVSLIVGFLIGWRLGF